MVSSRGLTLYYRLAGQGTTSLVLIHELGGSVDNWQEVIANLGEGFRILHYDLRGAGQSSAVRDAFTMQDQATDLENLIEHARLSPPFLIVGAAAGSAVAVVFAARHPDRVSGVILCPPALSVTPERRRYLQERSDLAAREGMHAIAEQTLAKSFPEAVIRDRDRYETYRKRFLETDPVSYGWSNRALAESTADALAPSVECPVLLLAGLHDPLRPPDEVRRVAATFPNATVEEIDSAHIMSQQAPAELAQRIVRFHDQIS